MLLEQKISIVHFCREIMCVETFCKIFFHVQCELSVGGRQNYVLTPESSGWLQAAGVPEHLQPNLLCLFWDATVYQIPAEVRKHHTDIFTPSSPKNRRKTS